MIWSRTLSRVPAGETFAGREIITFRHGDQVVRVPKCIGDRYDVERVLTQGGMGVLLVATDTCLGGRPVLVKITKPDEDACFRDDHVVPNIAEIVERDRACLEDEMLNLIHFSMQVDRVPTVCNFIRDYSPQLHGPHGDEEWYWSGDDTADLLVGEPFLVLQFIDGRNVESLLDSNGSERDFLIGPVGSEKRSRYARDLGRELCTVLAQLHTLYKVPDDDGRESMCYQIYQDLKPDNVIRTTLGDHFLVDFGAVAPIVIDGNEHRFHGRRLAGTLGYQAPEVAEYHEATALSDIYSLGATLYHAITGVRPQPDVDLSRLIEDELLPCPEKLHDKLLHIMHACLQRPVNDRKDAIGRLADPDFLKTFTVTPPSHAEILRETFRSLRRQES